MSQLTQKGSSERRVRGGSARRAPRTHLGWDGKAPKTEAGTRTVPMLPALRRLLAAWKLRAPHTRSHDVIVAGGLRFASS